MKTLETTTTPAIRKLASHKYAVASASTPGYEYIVMRGLNNEWSCDCADFFFNAEHIAKSQRDTCKHCRAVAALEAAEYRKSREVCTARPKAAPPVELGLYLLTGGNQGRA